MSKKEVLDKKSDEQDGLPVDEKEDSQSIGEIRINHSVIECCGLPGEEHH